MKIYFGGIETEVRNYICMLIEARFEFDIQEKVVEGSGPWDGEDSGNNTIVILGDDFFTPGANTTIKFPEDVPVIIMGARGMDQHQYLTEQRETNENIRVIPQAFNADQLIESMTDLFEYKRGGSENDFRKVSLERLLNMSKLGCDLFINASRGKFIKIIHKNDQFDPDKIRKYLHEKDCRYFYIREEDFPTYKEDIVNQISGLLDSEDLSSEFVR